ncbi:MAG TPA: RecQ family zinc-binding domain-containing protein, partial [Rhodothermales bacterium]|nr:RecQ family zinc-binding domain-containing protein [Rhodothermales bacterium]
LERRTRLPRARLLRGFFFLKQRGVIDWMAPADELRVVFQEPRPTLLPVDDVAVRRALRRAEVRLGDMLRYARSVSCRRHFLLSYFGEESPANCGRCDVCLGGEGAFAVAPDDEPLIRSILELVQKGKPESDWPIGDGRNGRPGELVGWLVQEQYIRGGVTDGAYTLLPKGRAYLEQWHPRG